MAQIVKLRRSSISGQKPTNSNLQLGEIALNTTDGKAFMSVSGSNGPTIQEFVITNTVNTGSIHIIGSITASNFTGSIDWNNIINSPNLVSGSSQIIYSGLTGLPDVVLTSQTASMNVLSASYATTAAFALNTLGGGNQAAIGTYRTYQQTSPQSTWSFQHNIGQRYPIFQVFDENGDVVVPSKIRAIDDNNSEILFSIPQSGVIIASLGGGNGAVEQFTNSSLWVVNHNLGTEYPNVTVWDNSKKIIIPNKIQSITNNQLEISFDVPISGYVSVARGGHILSGSSLLWENVGNKPNNIVSGSEQLTGSYDSRYVLSGSITQTTWNNIENKPEGIVSGSEQLIGIFATTGSNNFIGTEEINGDLIVTGSILVSGSLDISNGIILNNGLPYTTADRYLHTVSSETGSWVINHNFNYKYVNIDVYDNNDEQLIPLKISAISTNTVQVDFAIPTSGNAIISIGGARSTSIFNQTGSFYNTNYNIGITGSLVVTGDVDAANFNTTSDKLIKTNLKKIEGSLNKIEKLNGYTFNWLESYSDDKTRQIGMLANEVYEVQPELTSERNILLNGEEEKILLLDYSKITALLIEGIKELNKEVKELKNKIKRK